MCQVGTVVKSKSNSFCGPCPPVKTPHTLSTLWVSQRIFDSCRRCERNRFFHWETPEKKLVDSKRYISVCIVNLKGASVHSSYATFRCQEARSEASNLDDFSC